jgi:hypothetical protein
MIWEIAEDESNQQDTVRRIFFILFADAVTRREIISGNPINILHTASDNLPWVIILLGPCDWCEASQFTVAKSRRSRNRYEPPSFTDSFLVFSAYLSCSVLQTRWATPSWLKM